jgi:hypothetical protein
MTTKSRIFWFVGRSVSFFKEFSFGAKVGDHPSIGKDVDKTRDDR